MLFRHSILQHDENNSNGSNDGLYRRLSLSTQEWAHDWDASVPATYERGRGSGRVDYLHN